jgi:hypothetical protein
MTMAFINLNHRGLAYGDGYLQGDGQLGQVVRIVGNDLFAVNTTPTAKSFGILIKDYKNGEMPGIYCMGGVYETDVSVQGQFRSAPGRRRHETARAVPMCYIVHIIGQNHSKNLEDLELWKTNRHLFHPKANCLSIGMELCVCRCAWTAGLSG